jgi:putative hemolysin
MKKGKMIIDVGEVLRRKAPQIGQKIPAFALNYLIRKVHQNELNDILERYAALDGVAFMQALVREFDITLQIEGAENLPSDGQRRYLFASNHPLGGLDGICLAAMLGERYDSNLYCLVNDLLLYIPNLRSIFVPVNKHGAQNRAAAQRIDDVFRSNAQVLTFPAGLCSRKRHGEICDLEWKKSFIQKTLTYDRDVVPVYFEGRNSSFFYRLANLRQRLGIKVNIEMLFLPDEMFKSKHRTFRIHIGKPIPSHTFDRSRSAHQWAQWVKEQVYMLRNK